MSRIVDNLIAFKILYMLITPFTETKAYKLGIIDAQGKNLRKTSTLKTGEEREAYTYLDRLVFNMKKIINKLPGGESRLKSIVAALFLVKEYYESNDRTTSLMEEKYIKLLEKVDSGVILVEEEIIVKKFLENRLVEEGEGTASNAIANVTGSKVSTNIPVIKKKDIKKYQVMARRKPVNVVT
jgi:hypothetical protein